MESKAPLFKHNDIIWGKVTGHPWWPGIIHQLQESENLDLYRVDFFGYPPSHSMLPANKIIKYKDHNKIPIAENIGRASPGLKKAISEASILFHALEQSKSSPTCKPNSQLFIYDNDYTAYTLQKTEQKIPSQNLIKNQQCPLSFSENQLVQKTEPCIIGKMNSKVRINRQKKEKKSKKQEQKLQQLLKQYKLEIIPEVQKEVRKRQMNKLVRLIYKISRSQYSIQQSRQKALFYKDKISSLIQLKQFIAQQKQEKQKEENIQNCTQKINSEP